MTAEIAPSLTAVTRVNVWRRHATDWRTVRQTAATLLVSLHSTPHDTLTPSGPQTSTPRWRHKVNWCRSQSIALHARSMSHLTTWHAVCQSLCFVPLTTGDTQYLETITVNINNISRPIIIVVDHRRRWWNWKYHRPERCSATDPFNPLPSTDHVSRAVYWHQFATHHHCQLLSLLIDS